MNCRWRSWSSWGCYQDCSPGYPLIEDWEDAPYVEGECHTRWRSRKIFRSEQNGGRPCTWECSECLDLDDPATCSKMEYCTESLTCPATTTSTTATTPTTTITTNTSAPTFVCDTSYCSSNSAAKGMQVFRFEDYIFAFSSFCIT